jgi:cyclophilin family peptidyl-prolyl cis-trans isomerase
MNKLSAFSLFGALLLCALHAGPAFAAPNPKVLIETNVGEITVELWPGKAPNSVKNFLRYVEDGHYNGTIFHRVIKRFMIQGGGFDPDFKQKPNRGPIQNEANNGEKNVRGTLAMARTSDPHSATAQFFINIGNNEALNYRAKTEDDWGYTVFGKVIEGTRVVMQIGNFPTGRGGPFPKDVPVKPIIIERVTLIPAAAQPEEQQ